MSSIIKLPTVMNKVSALVNKVAVGEEECFDRRNWRRRTRGCLVPPTTR